MTSSVHVVSIPICASGESLPLEQLFHRAKRAIKRIGPILPEPRRNDLQYSFKLVAHDNQLRIDIRLEIAAQRVLPLDDSAAQPPAEALAQEATSLRLRIEQDMTAIYARIDDNSVPPLPPRLASALRTHSGKEVHLDLSTGPTDLRYPHEPAPVEDTVRSFCAKVNAHFPDSLALSQIFHASEAGLQRISATKGSMSLILDRADLAEQARIHRRVAELFIGDTRRRLYFLGRGQVSPSTGRVERLLFERLLDPP